MATHLSLKSCRWTLPPDTKTFRLPLLILPLKPLKIHFLLSLPSSPLQPGHCSQSYTPVLHAQCGTLQEENLETEAQEQRAVEDNASEQEQSLQDEQVGRVDVKPGP